MKKILNTLLVLTLLVLVPTFLVHAENTETNGTNAGGTGSITISNAINGKTYSAYQILTLESYDNSKKAYTYTIKEGWTNFFTNGGIGSQYVDVDSQGYVTWKESEPTESDMKAFAQAALEYAKKNVTASASKKVEGTTVTFTGLNLGYYLVDSSVGALCSLTTTKPSATAKEKNTEPTVEKEVKEAGTWGEKNNASIGQTVEFKTTITASDGAENYVLYDVMSKGLTYSGVKTVKLIKNGAAESSATDVDASYYTVSTEDESYTFTIAFAKVFTDTLVAGDKIVVEYTAVLNEEAVIYDQYNENKTWLEYGDETDDTNKTPEDITQTYTYQFDLVKTDDSSIVLTGAKFKLYDSVTGGNEIKVVKVKDGVYRVATQAEIDENKAVEIEAGVATILGLDSGTYYLEETQAPDGYNKLAGREEVKIEGSNLVAETKSTEEEVTDEETGETTKKTTVSYVKGGINIINKTGEELPTTGGMGTVLFITIGSLMVLGFGVLLVTKLRLSKMSA